MTPKERVEEELIQLDMRIMNLGNFILNEDSRYQYISDYEKELLRSQHIIMQGYSEILSKRLKIWQD